MRLIDADALESALADRVRRSNNSDFIPPPTWNSAVDIVVNAPSIDAVPVVRCKDCKWWCDYGCAIRIVDESDKPKENDFCSFGERKDEGQNMIRKLRLIDADALEKQGWIMNRTVAVDFQTMEMQTKKPTDFPTIDAVPVVHGEWVCVMTEEWCTFDECKCSVCGVVEYFNKGWKKFSYCPSCGAKMGV